MLSEKGQTLIELIVVISVSVIVIGALVFATISSLRNAQFSKNQAQATKLAQEGMESVRVSRDRNNNISSLAIGSNTVTSWNGDNTSCPGNTSSIWCNQINGNCGDTTLSLPTFCYFKFGSGGLQPLTAASDIPSGAEDPLDDGKFKRVVILSDDSTTYDSQKTVTVIVRWTDFSGNHESRLTTILRKI